MATRNGTRPAKAGPTLTLLPGGWSELRHIEARARELLGRVDDHEGAEARDLSLITLRQIIHLIGEAREAYASLAPPAGLPVEPTTDGSGVGKARMTPEIEAADKILLRALVIGKLTAEAGIVLTDPTFAAGRKTRHHAEKMRDRKAKASPDLHRAKRQKAEDAMTWARKAFPVDAYDGNTKRLMSQAAKKLGKSVDTIERWLKYES
jgi:hypothetical protein